MAPRRRSVPAALLGGSLLALLLAPAAAGLTLPDADRCERAGAEVVRVEVQAELAGDGHVTGVRRDETVTEASGDGCRGSSEEDAAGLPVDVAVLHTAPSSGSLEVEELASADGPVTTRIAVRDRTAAPRGYSVDAPTGPEEREDRIAVPHVVRLSITYPPGWSAVAPGLSDVRTDVVDGGVRVGHTAVLFPPITGDEVVLPVRAAPGRGVPTIAVEVTPITGAEAARLGPDELDRDAAAVVAALTETGADGADELAEGTAELSDGLDELADGADQLAAGLGEAAGGGAELRRGADQVASGAAALAAGMRELSAGLRPLADGARQVAEGNRQLGAQLDRAADGADELAEGNEGLADGADELAATNRQLGTGLRGLRDLLGQLPDLGPVTDAVIGPADDLLAGAAAASAAADGLASGSRQLAEGNRELARGLREAADGSRELADGSRRVADGADEAADGSRELADGSAQLAEGADALAEGVHAYTRGVEEAAGASGQLADGADDAADGAAALADGAAQLPGALRQATETADRENSRRAEERAIVARGRQLADAAVDAATGGARTGTLSTELVAAGSAPPPPAVLFAVAAVVLAAGATGATWWRRREGGSW